jgi:hypothetical protein
MYVSIHRRVFLRNRSAGMSRLPAFPGSFTGCLLPARNGSRGSIVRGFFCEILHGDNKNEIVGWLAES